MLIVRMMIRQAKTRADCLCSSSTDDGARHRGGLHIDLASRLFDLGVLLRCDHRSGIIVQLTPNKLGHVRLNLVASVIVEIPLAVL
jgi:hypothetical protein